MSRKVLYFISGISIFLLFVLFSFLVHKNLFVHTDFNMTIRLQDHISRRFDDLFSGLSEFGQVEPMSIVLFIIILGLLFAKKFLSAISTLVFFVVLHVFELYGKFFVSHLPPPEFMLRTKRLVNFPQFTVRTENSYPSGHSGRAMFLTAIIIILIFQSKRFPRALKALLIVVLLSYDAVLLISRIYLGEHWMSDVIGGSLLGIALGFLTGGLLENRSVSLSSTLKINKSKK